MAAENAEAYQNATNQTASREAIGFDAVGGWSYSILQIATRPGTTPATVKSKEMLESARVSLVTLGDIDD